VTTSAPQAAARLLAVCPDVAELLAVVALGMRILCFINLHPDSNVAEAMTDGSFPGTLLSSVELRGTGAGL
jgi:hypothetical protein